MTMHFDTEHLLDKFSEYKGKQRKRKGKPRNRMARKLKLQRFIDYVKTAEDSKDNVEQNKLHTSISLGMMCL